MYAVDLRRGVDRIILEQPGAIGDGGNSGFQAFNLALAFGARRVVLVGFDMRLDEGVHWHGPHSGREGLHNPTLRNVIRWRDVFLANADALAAGGFEVFRESDISALTCFPVLSIAQALERFKQ